jgi:glycosyltransferase involved in cell wall biosynthesis
MIRRLPDEPIYNSAISNLISLKFSIIDFFSLNISRLGIGENYKSGLVSVLIPTYNRKNILFERAIKSVLNQTYQDFEIIIVDDGSSDGTYDKLIEFNHPKIKVIKNSRSRYRYPNKAIYHWFTGGVSALNRGLKYCQGQYIARIDDDDIWTEDHIEKLLSFLEKNQYEFVYSHLKAKMTASGNEEIITNYPDPLGNTCTWFFKSYLKHFKLNIHCWRKKKNRVFDVDVHDRYFKAGVRIGYLKEVTAIYLPRPNEEFAGSKAYIANSEEIELKHSKQ